MTPTVSASTPESVRVTTTPTAQPPSPTPTVIATPGTSYEAEASQNTLAGGAKVVSCTNCSNGKKVYYIGSDIKHNTNGTLQFNNVSESTSGRYKLTIYYLDGFTYGLTGYISVNGGPRITFNVSSTRSWNTLGITSVIVSLNAGNNTIEFYNSSSNVPDLDRIVV
jgi:hypothetical protein